MIKLALYAEIKLRIVTVTVAFFCHCGESSGIKSFTKISLFFRKISTPPSHLSDESKAITQADVVMPDTVIAVEQA